MSKKLLEEARQHIFSLGLQDLASALSYENMVHGLGKVLFVLDSNAFCVFGPDATITRNTRRWESGFGYGAVIKWFDKGIAFPEMRPNGCGMILVRLDELPEKREFLERVTELNESDLSLQGIPLKPDFGKGNHFFELYKPLEISPKIGQRMPSQCFYAILHCSSPERKHEIYGMIEEGRWVETPLGKICMLMDSEAKEYFKLWKDYESFCKKRREILVKEVLDEYEIISNETHQGLSDKNEIRLGCYDTKDKSELFPIALRWDVPVYVLGGKQNLSEEVIDRLDFKERAEELGLLEELKNINILPHGGGYKISIPYTEVKVVRIKTGRYFILKKPNIFKYGEITFTTPRELPFEYRSRSVIEKTIECDLGIPVAKLQPIETLKV